MQIRNVLILITFKGDRKGRPYKQFIPEESVGVGVGVGVGLWMPPAPPPMPPPGSTLPHHPKKHLPGNAK